MPVFTSLHTVCACLDHWLDDKTLVVMIEGNLYSPQASAMVSFVLTVEKNRYGTIDNEVFIEVSDYALTTIDESTQPHNTSGRQAGPDNDVEKRFVLTHYLFAALLFVIVSSRLVSPLELSMLVRDQTARPGEVHS